jgi:hypothetical protein
MLLIVVGLARADELPSMINGSGNPIRWSTMPIEYAVDPSNDVGLDPDGVVASVVSSAGVWGDLDGSTIDFRFRGSTSDPVTAHDEVNAVYFEGDWEFDPDLLAITSVWSYENGMAVGFDMQVNAMDHDWSLDASKEREKADVQNALAHEFGHVVGIGHLEKSPEATMYPSSPPGETMKRDLSDEDVWVALNFYPGDGAVLVPPGDDEGGMTVPALCSVAGGPAGVAPVVGGLAAVLLARGRAARRRSEVV